MTLLFVLATAAALVGGALLGVAWKPPAGVLAVALAFASGALLTAVAVDLMAESFATGGIPISGAGILAGSLVFVVVDTWLDRRMGSEPTGNELLAAVVLDGVPENLALGIALLAGSGSEALPLLVGIVSSNFPEALGSAAKLREQDRDAGSILKMWGATAALLAVALLAGNLALRGADDAVRGMLLSFAGGAVLASLADTLMPTAYRDGGPLVAFATVAGFFLTFVLAQ